MYKFRAEKDGTHFYKVFVLNAARDAYIFSGIEVARDLEELAQILDCSEDEILDI